MSGSLPSVRGGFACCYPVTRTVSFLTDIALGLNQTEQRFKRRPPLTQLVLPYSRINATETAAMKTFFENQKGSYDSSWSLTLGSTTYANLAFEDDTFTAREEPGSQTTYSFTLRARQTQNAGQTAGTAGAAFPALSSGARAQLPYTQARRFNVLRNQNAIGMQYTWAWVAALFPSQSSGFPAGSLRGWQLEYPALSDADLATIEAHFRNQFGRWNSFSFTDPDDGVVHPKSRYDVDSLVVNHIGVNQNSLTLSIMETN